MVHAIIQDDELRSIVVGKLINRTGNDALEDMNLYIECHKGCSDMLEIIRLQDFIEQGDYVSAKPHYQTLSTTTKEMLPESFHDWLNACQQLEKEIK